ncbi:TetR/AcrR family transcriptional regulator [Antricoccus suffuscus]|uniref:TetR/AcrR family transcriptional regulator n=1 Tax=Antricoccus suffuscus TaxID=1629062 RepID=UPI00192D4796|nr:hypothetical protein [Antricoccus suffuscus]
MSSSADDSRQSGFGRRRQRLSDAETEQRMLRSAADAVAATGLTVSLDHIRLEDVIRDAGVSRSTVYRRWPNKDLFLGDLLLDLARANAPKSATGSKEITELVRRSVLARLDAIRSPIDRLQLAAELVRDTGQQDFQHINESREWRTYLALTVTFIGLPPGDLRDQIQEVLAESERAFTARIAASHRTIADLLGLRLRAGIDVTFETVGHLANAMMRGLIVKALATPSIATERVAGDLYGATGDWSLASLGLISVVMTYLEPDPDVTWDDKRVTQLRQQLEETDDLFE